MLRRYFAGMNADSLFIGASRAAPPQGGVIKLLAPAQVSSQELRFIEGPKVILGGPPCAHWSSAICERTDTLYVLVGDTALPESLRGAAAALPSAPVAQLRRHFTHLIELRQRYPDGLPEFDECVFRWKGIEVTLTRIETAVLQRLYQFEGTIVGREDLAGIAEIPTGGSRALEAHIHRLRQKISIPGFDLQTARQRGFRLVLS